MQFNGGKQAIAAHIANNLGTIEGVYWEPFVGAGSVIQRVNAPVRIGTDIDPHIINFLIMTQSGWNPPTDVSEEEYYWWRYFQPTSPEEFAHKAFVGYGCSFGGKFFGGYARSKNRNYALNAANSVAKQQRLLEGILFSVEDFFVWEPYPHGMVIYCDPPYANTTKVGNCAAFDSKKFWERCLDLSHRHKVIVSEFFAPKGWTPIQSWTLKDGLRKRGNHSMKESLWKIDYP